MMIKKYDITTKNLDDLIKKISDSKKFKEIFLDTTIAFVYDIIFVLDNSYSEYNYLVKNKEDYESFLMKWQDNYNYIFEKMDCQYPFVIRNYYREDLDELGIDYKKFRLTIKKKKIPFFLRESLPVIEKDGKIMGIMY